MMCCFGYCREVLVQSDGPIQHHIQRSLLSMKNTVLCENFEVELLSHPLGDSGGNVCTSSTVYFNGKRVIHVL